MPPFHTIAIPHDDILRGRLTMEVFAADLGEVARGRGVAEYRDPALFFQKTFVTAGLRTLFDVVQQRLAGQGGDPVIQLQTPFGGGKTHALIALYHKAAEWGARRVVMVGTTMAATDTLWGQIEQQLTGQRVRFTDLVAPGRGEALRALLTAHAPALILIDELLEYVTKAAGTPVGESTLAAQTIAFMQELTELIGAIDRVVLVITLPTSLIEHYDPSAERMFQQLQRVSGRVERIYAPVRDDEITHVIRRRLFAQIKEWEAMQAVDTFMEYATREGLLPAGVEPSEYRARFLASYPFLPDVVDALYQRWGSFSSFQRTRGVLRLLALVIAAHKDRDLPFISLADINLSDAEIRRELLKHIGAEFDSVIAADITAPDAGAVKVSADLGSAYRGLHLGERAATAIFMSSFSGGVEKGATLVDIKRNAATLSSPAAVVAEAVEKLKGRLFYLQYQSDRYFFSNQANLNRLLLTRMENIADREIQETEKALLRQQAGSAPLNVFIWCDRSADIPDTPDLKLIILPDAHETRMNELRDTKGEARRVYRNTLFILTPLESERAQFAVLVRRMLAYQRMQNDASLKLTDEQRREIRENLKRLEGDLGDAVRRLYRQVYLPAREGWKRLDMGLPTHGETRPLSRQVYDHLRSQGEILEKIAPLAIRERFLKDRDTVSTGQLVRAGLVTPGEARVISESAWRESIIEGVQKGLFGLGDMHENRPVCRSYNETPSVSFADSEVLIRDDLCKEQRARKPTETPTYPPASDSSRPIHDGPGTTFKPEPAPPIGEEQRHDAVSAPNRTLTLAFTIPRGRVSGLMGVLHFLQTKYAHMEITLHLRDGALSDQELEEKVMEAFRQMGITLRIDPGATPWE
jgi:hypothetical protein